MQVPKGIRPKKKLAQHFLNDPALAKKITHLLTTQNCQAIIELGPGTGVFTQWLQHTHLPLYLVEIDPALAQLLQGRYPDLHHQIINADFLKTPLNTLHKGPIALIGNFPYNISAPIFFSILEQRHHIYEIVCIIQREVAERICAKPGNKTYGLLSVLLQTFYTTSYHLTIPPRLFTPPPKVYSGVIHLQRKTTTHLPCSASLFFTVVKTAFSKRRKMLRNALSSLGIPLTNIPSQTLTQRAEALSPEDFIQLTHMLEHEKSTKGNLSK